MKTYNTYFTTSDTLKKYLHTNNIRDNKKLLIQIFTSLTNEQDIKTMLSKISSLLPSANIIGATSASEICNTNITDDKTVISITQFIDTLVTTTFVQECKDDFTTGKTIVQKLTQEDTKLIITFTNGLHCNAQEYLKGIHQTNKDITVAGGMASDTRNFKSTYVFTKDEISSQGAVGAGLHNQKLKIYTQAAFNWLSIGMEMIVTNADENRVFTIDNQSAYDIYTKYLGKDIAKKLPEAGLEYPLIIHKSNRKIARAVLVKHNDGSLTFGGNIKTGDIVTFGYGDSLDILEQSGIQFRKTLNEPIESIFIYSCIARYKFLQDAIIQEIEPLSMIAETAGFFTYGEFFSTKHSNELLNQTMTILAINESKPSTDKHITINTKKIKQTHQGRSVKALSNLLHNTIVALNKRYEILQSKEASLQLSQAIGHMGSWEVDFKSGLSFWSKEMYNIYGYEEQTYTPTLDNFIQRIIDTDKHKAKHLIQQLNDGKIHNAALHSTKSDGSIINILINGQILFNKKNEAEKIVGTTLDITELTQVKKTTK